MKIKMMKQPIVGCSKRGQCTWQALWGIKYLDHAGVFFYLKDIKESKGLPSS